MSAGHAHAIPEAGNEKMLWWALGLTMAFLLAEVAAGIVFGSLALLADAAHMFTDAAALAIAVAAVRMARRPADAKRTYGYHRFEILAAAFNALLLFGVAFYILYEAWRRFSAPVEVQPLGMLAVAVLVQTGRCGRAVPANGLHQIRIACRSLFSCRNQIECEDWRRGAWLTNRSG